MAKKTTKRFPGTKTSGFGRGYTTYTFFCDVESYNFKFTLPTGIKNVVKYIADECGGHVHTHRKDGKARTIFSDGKKMWVE